MAFRKRHNYKNLKIWQLRLEITNDISDTLIEFPKHEHYDLSSQMSRCSVSIPSNIAEGSAKTDKSFSNYLDIALGSSFKSGTQLLVANHIKYINADILKNLKIK
ncbi:four helix bundle protein [Mariniflexile soesokkakense]|uniref:Four helix bundle protein n=1 Tax=Mariniflexile soesokkakense TaxID=1343160 RepID=A0ABV0A850_9FLAO